MGTKKGRIYGKGAPFKLAPQSFGGQFPQTAPPLESPLHMSVLIWFETIIEYWFNYSLSSKFYSGGQTSTFGQPFCCLRRFS